MKNIKKTIFTAVLLGVLIVPGFASAQATTAELQAQIQALFAQIKQLQAELNASQSAVSTSAPLPIISESQVSSVIIQPSPIPPKECFTIKRRLYRGSRDSSTGGEVAELQRFLAQDSSIYPEALVTGYFGSLTERAVKKWQAKNGVVSSGSAASTGYGVVGPKTRIKIKSSYRCRPLPIPGNQSKITVISPNGGEVWEVGKTYEISWVSKNLSSDSADNIFISLQYGGDQGEILFTNTSNDGIELWTVPTHLTTGGGYKILVRANTDPYPQDVSDAPFSIVNASTTTPSITVISPNGGEVWEVGETRTIRWSSSSVNKVSIWLCEADVCGRFGTIPPTGVINTGSYSFVVSTSTTPFGAYIPANNLKIRVASEDDYPVSSVYDDSDAVFSIVDISTNAPSITVISPNGGEVYTIGAPITIKWTSGEPGIARIDLLNADKSYKETIYGSKGSGNQVPNTSGSWNWDGPQFSDSYAGTYYVRIYEYVQGQPSDSGRSDLSDASFSIVEAGTETLTASSGVQPEQAIAFRGQEDIPFTAVNLTASGDDVSIRYFTVERAGVGDDEAFSRISILDENGRELGRSSLNANSQAVIRVSLRVRDGEEKQITIAADISTDIGYGGQIAYFSLVNIDSDAETLGGLPVTGTGHTLSDVSIDEVGYSPQLSQMANTLQVAQGILEKMIESLKNW